MSTLTQRLDDYLVVRRSLGFDLSYSARVLRRFTAFADREGGNHITVDLFLRWKAAYGNADNNTWSARLGMVRVFARWLQAHDVRTEVPPAGLIAGKLRRGRPYIYSDKEIVAIVTHPDCLLHEMGPDHPERPVHTHLEYGRPDDLPPQGGSDGPADRASNDWRLSRTNGEAKDVDVEELPDESSTE